MPGILSIVALLCLTTYTYGRVERTLSGVSTARNLTMVSDSATEDVRVGRALSSLKKCPKAVAQFMKKDKNQFGNTRCEASNTVSLEDCQVTLGVYYHHKGQYSEVLGPVRKTNDKFVCCWACRVWEKCGTWEWYKPESSKGRCRLFNVGREYEERPFDPYTYAGIARPL
eukprot:g416.t1